MNLQKGKILPQAIDLETSVLCALLIDSRAADEVFAVIRTPNVFYKPEHFNVFVAICNLYENSNPVDLMTVSHELKRMGKLTETGGDFFLMKLAQVVASAANVEYHSRVLVQKFIARSVIAMNNQINALAFDPSTDVFELLDKYQEQFDNITALTISGRQTISLPDALVSLKLVIERLSANTDEMKMVGVPTGFKNTDKHTGGYRGGDVVILAARPGMGKTSKVLKTVVANLKVGNPVGFISLEMSMMKLAARLVAIDTDFHLKQLTKSGFEKNDYFQTYDAHCKRMNAYPLYVDDSGINNIGDIVIRAKAWKRSKGIELLVIDYLQLMDDKTVNSSNRETIVSSISRKIKMLAVELQIPIIALSQLSRAVETRGGSKRPTLPDLRDSGAIEQDADIVEFIYRPEYYKQNLDPEEYDVKNQRLIALGADSEINYAKYRDGAPAVTLLKWIGDKTKFIDVDDSSDNADYIDKPLPKMNASQAFDTNDSKTVFDG